MQRLKVPPAINQFSKSLNKNQATELFKLLNNYKPETSDEKKARLKTAADAKAGGAANSGPKPGPVIKFGLKHGASDAAAAAAARLAPRRGARAPSPPLPRTHTHPRSRLSIRSCSQ